jgi:hypothetical protein
VFPQEKHINNDYRSELKIFFSLSKDFKEITSRITVQ